MQLKYKTNKYTKLENIGYYYVQYVCIQFVLLPYTRVPHLAQISG